MFVSEQNVLEVKCRSRTTFSDSDQVLKPRLHLNVFESYRVHRQTNRQTNKQTTRFTFADPLASLIAQPNHDSSARLPGRTHCGCYECDAPRDSAWDPASSSQECSSSTRNAQLPRVTESAKRVTRGPYCY